MNSLNTIYITPKKYIHYLIIYLMISLNGSFWFFLNQDTTLYSVLVLYVVLLIRYKRFRKVIPLLIVGALLYTVTVVRLINNGGIGFESWYLWSGQILIVFAAYLFNQEKFAQRYVSLVFLLAVISLIFWSISIFSPNLLVSLFTASEASSYNGIFYGKWFYVYRTSLVDTTISERNVGIFTEPGRYQTVLIGCMYILLFYRHKLSLSRKKYLIVFVTILGTIVSVASTTGFIGLCILIICYLIKNNIYIKTSKIDRNFQRNILIIICILMTAMIIDISVNGENSIYNTIVLEKVTDASSDSGSSGGARVNAMSTYLEVMLEHPFGAGYDNLTKALMLSTYESNVAGAGLMGFFAALGIIPSIVMLYLIVCPFFMGKQRKWIECIAFLSVYFNTGLAQSYAFYPALLIIPVLFYLDNNIILYKNTKLR